MARLAVLFALALALFASGSQLAAGMVLPVDGADTGTPAQDATASAGPRSSTRSVVLADRTWVCNGPVDLDSVSVSISAKWGSRGADAVHLESGCAGRIGRLDVVTSVADGVKVADGAHDLVVGGGSIRCLAKAPTLHQDGVQVMGGARITFSGLRIDCGRPSDTLVNSDLFINRAGKSTTPPTDVVCVSCEFGGGAAHTVDIQDSVRSGVVASTLCTAKYPKLTLTVGAGAVAPVDAGNTVGGC